MNSNPLPPFGPAKTTQYSPLFYEVDVRRLGTQRRVLKRLKAWHRWERDKHRSVADFLLRSSSLFFSRPILPTNDELLSLAEYYFPHRDYLPVTVCDFEGEKDGVYSPVRQHFTTLNLIDKYLEEKPSHILFRWIFAPIGAGEHNQLIQSRFISATGKPDTTADTNYFKVLSFRDPKIVQNQVDVFNLLQDVPESFQHTLKQPWTSTRIVGELDIGRTDFWKAAASDMPGPLSQTSMIDPSRVYHGKASKDFLSTRQSLRQHPNFQNFMLTTDNMTCVSRSDGVLLTLLSSKGLNYLDAPPPPIPWPNVTMFPESFVLGVGQPLHLAQTSRWTFPSDLVKLSTLERLSSPNQLVRAFLIDIISNFYTSVRKFDDSGVEEAYAQIVQELKNRSSSRIRRQESVKLVRDIMACMNEMSQLQKVGEAQAQTLRDLFLGLPNPFESLRSENNQGNENIKSRIQHLGPLFQKRIKSFERLPVLSDELKSSLDIFFQLKIIEQNEMALLAESNNQAILVFTVVTVVFLPLSFFTSYFGMNLQGISNTTKDERYFWMVCGPVTVSIVLFTLLFGFRKRFRDVLWSDETFVRSTT